MTDVKFKDGVSPDGVQIPAIRIIVAAAGVYATFGLTHVTVTSITDGNHSDGSLHYKGLAVDLRTRHDKGGAQWPDHVKECIASRLRLKLGDDYDVVVEGTHIHAEYDPK